MVVFLSYAHEDFLFVNKLAVELMKRDIAIWMDRWELNLGDSLNVKIKTALREASFLCIVLSKSSINSEWCKSEINTALLKEIEEKRSVIIPITIDDCEVPEILKDRLIVDFKGDFEQALSILSTTFKAQLNDCLDRVQGPEYLSDIAIDWELKNNLFEVHIDAIQFAKDQEGSILTRATIRANRQATKHYIKYIEIGLEWFVVDLMLDFCTQIKEHDKVKVIISDNRPLIKMITFQDKNSKFLHDINISIRRLGKDTGRDILYDYGILFNQIVQSRFAKSRKFTSEEEAMVCKIIGSNPINRRKNYDTYGGGVRRYT